MKVLPWYVKRRKGHRGREELEESGPYCLVHLKDHYFPTQEKKRDLRGRRPKGKQKTS